MTDVIEKQPTARYVRKREDILEGAVEVFNRLGVRGATLADVAAAVGLNLTSIRHYFQKREDLVAALVERSIETLTTVAVDAARENAREDRIAALVSGYFSLRRRIRLGQHLDTIHFADVRTMRTPHAERIWPLYTEMFRVFRRAIATREELKADYQRVNARTQTVVAQFIRAVFWLPDYALEDYDRVEARFLDILLNGLAASPARWKPYATDLPEEERPDRRSIESFLMAATQIINVEGYRGASVQRIAERLNVTKGSFYHHINAKDDVVAACCDRTFRLMSDAQRLALASQPLGIEQASMSIATLVRLQQTEAGPLLRNSALTSMEGVTRHEMTSRMDRIAQRFADMISDGILDGSARACDTRIAGHMLMAMVNSAEEAPRWVKGFDKDNAVDLYARPIFTGLYS